ncbi:hypothetical protein O0L34_g14412 [Tuta absoluta]|nr:hypothetical protein O0L34_g14412 [Tuta absoluta]
MILKKSVTAVIFCIAWIHAISGSSYSKVYVNMGTKAGPGVQYIGYGAPPVAYGPTLAELSAPPAQSVPPYPQAASFAPPCVIPVCVLQQAVPQYDTNAPIVGYQAPNSPIVVTGEAPSSYQYSSVVYDDRTANQKAPSAPIVVTGNAPSNYQYSYVVYDDRTGDQKAASEGSDGGVIRGRYSFLQPDGYVREVQYTADDVTGFNAVVNYLPAGGDSTVEVKGINPCPDPKIEALKQDTTPEKKPAKESSTTTPSPSIQVITMIPKETPETTKPSAMIQDNVKEEDFFLMPKAEEQPLTTSPKVTSETTTSKTTQATTETPTTPIKNDGSEEYVVIVSSSLEERTTTLRPETTTKTMEEPTTTKEEITSKKEETTTTKEETTKTPMTTVLMVEKTTELPNTMSPKTTPETEIPTTPFQDDATEAPKAADEHPTTVAPSGEVVTAKVSENCLPSVQAPQPAVVQLVQPPQSPVVQSYPAPQPAFVQFVPAPQTVPAYYTNTVPAGYVSYDQLLKCIQKMQIADQQAVYSPLTYILLPSNAKPC